MIEVDLSVEMAAAWPQVKQEHLDSTQSSGVTSTALANVGKVQESFGIANVEFLAGNLYRPAIDLMSAAAMIQPVYDNGEVIDLIAWTAFKPHDWYWRTGNGWALGIDAISCGGTKSDFKSIMIHTTPLKWLAAGGEGITILNWNAPEIQSLSAFDQLICFDHIVSTSVAKILAQPFPVPQIVIHGTHHAA